MDNVNQAKIDSLTIKITEAIKNGQIIPYKRGWTSPPLQSLTGWKYRGKNLCRASGIFGIGGLASPFYCTYLQSQKYGGLKKGAKGGRLRLCACHLTAWDVLERDKPEEAKKASKEEKRELKNTPVSSGKTDKFTTIFNCADLVNPPDYVARWSNKLALVDIDKATDKDKMGRLFKILQRLPMSVKIGGSQPVSTGTGIVICPVGSYNNICRWVGDTLHEVTHEIRHNQEYKSRFQAFGKEAPRYLEEMIAEMGSMFLSNALSLPFDNEREVNGLEYIRSWSAQRVKPLVDVAIREATARTDFIIKVLTDSGIACN